MVAPSRSWQSVEDVPLVVVHRLAKAVTGCVKVGADEGGGCTNLGPSSLLVSTPCQVI
ncbi:MAG: hypothetical protein ACJ75S_05225 [Solirubrobacterales bacterium]